MEIPASYTPIPPLIAGFRADVFALNAYDDLASIIDQNATLLY